MATYRHRKHEHTQDVGDWETVKIAVLERAGWRKVEDELPPEPPPAPPPEPEPKKQFGEAVSIQPSKRNRRKAAK